MAPIPNEWHRARLYWNSLSVLPAADHLYSEELYGISWKYQYLILIIMSYFKLIVLFIKEINVINVNNRVMSKENVL